MANTNFTHLEAFDSTATACLVATPTIALSFFLFSVSQRGTTKPTVKSAWCTHSKTHTKATLLGNLLVPCKYYYVWSVKFSIQLIVFFISMKSSTFQTAIMTFPCMVFDYLFLAIWSSGHWSSSLFCLSEWELLIIKVSKDRWQWSGTSMGETIQVEPMILGSVISDSHELQICNTQNTIHQSSRWV